MEMITVEGVYDYLMYVGKWRFYFCFGFFAVWSSDTVYDSFFMYSMYKVRGSHIACGLILLASDFTGKCFRSYLFS